MKGNLLSSKWNSLIRRRMLPVFCGTLLAGSSLLNAEQSSAQCTVPTVTNVAVTTATCPGNGSINVEAIGGSLLMYSVESGATEISESNSDGEFYSLNAGSYVIRVYNPEGDGCYIDTTIEVPNAYTPFSYSLSLADLCVGNNAATINVAATAGSSMPLTVAYWQGSPAATDGELTYTSVMSFEVPEANFGIWNVRVKDACGVAITQQINVANPYPADLTITSAGRNELPTECITTQPNIELWIRMQSLGTWVTADLLPAEGVEVSVYEASSSAPCDLSAATYVNTQTVDNSTGDVLTVPRGKRLIFLLTTPCGDSSTYCYNGEADQNPQISLSIRQQGCPTLGSPEGVIRLSAYAGDFMIPPMDYVITNSAGDTVAESLGDDRAFDITSGIVYGETYTSTVTDACGVVLSTSITTPVPGTPVIATNVSLSREGCTNIENQITARVTFEGHFPGLANENTAFELIAGPNAGVVGYRSSSRSIYFFNLSPGTHTVRITNPLCDLEVETTFDVGTSTSTLSQNIDLAAVQLCDPTGPGKGTLSYSADYNGAAWTQVKIFKVGTATPIYTGSAGAIDLTEEFGVGEYYAEMEIINGAGSDYAYCDNYTITSDTVSIIPSGSLPVITKKVPMVCENPVGSPDEGKISLEIEGAGPFVIEYKETTETTWVLYSPDSDGEELIEDLETDVTYNIRITDNCGAIITDNVTMGTLGAITFENEVQPCVGESYTLTAPKYANAVYSWTKDGSPIGGTSNKIILPTFTEANTGLYEVTIVIDQCVVRTAMITLYSQLCDSAVGNVTIAGNVFNDANGLTDGMVNGTGTNAGGVLYAALTDASGIVIGSVPVNADGTYLFTNVSAGDYFIVISEGKPTSGSTLTSGTLPDNYVPTGENIGDPTTVGDDGTVNGASAPITVATSNITNVNFGINQLPESFDKYQEIEGEPVVGTLYPLTETLSGSDPEDTDNLEEEWTSNTVTITSLPTNGFDLLYDGVPVTVGQEIPNFDPTKLAVSPTAATPVGTLNTSFEYVVVDAAQFADPTPATYEVVFSVPLAVKLLSFDANPKGNIVVLDWVTATETKNKGFEILRSDDASHFHSIGFVGSKAQGGNSSAQLVYTFNDNKPLTGRSYYKLKIVDIDGSAIYSDVKLVEMGNHNPIYVSPNPTNSYVIVEGLEKDNKVMLIDISGRILSEKTATDKTMQVDLSDYPSGIYQILVTLKNNKTFSTKILKKD